MWPTARAVGSRQKRADREHAEPRSGDRRSAIIKTALSPLPGLFRRIGPAFSPRLSPWATFCARPGGLRNPSQGANSPHNLTTLPPPWLWRGVRISQGGGTTRTSIHRHGQLNRVGERGSRGIRRRDVHGICSRRRAGIAGWWSCRSTSSAGAPQHQDQQAAPQQPCGATLPRPG